MGISTRPEFRSLPVRANTAVPFVPSVPMGEYHSAPFRRMAGTVARVFTLLILVGHPQSPLWAGNGGLGWGIPRFPMIEAMSAVSSPHTKAPAPSMISRSKSNPEPMMFFPRYPNFRASLMAMWSRSMARGYSFLT